MNANFTNNIIQIHPKIKTSNKTRLKDRSSVITEPKHSKFYT